MAASFAIDTHAIGGSVSGLTGSGLVLNLNGAENLAIGGDGPFVFDTRVDSQADYLVTVGQQPTAPAQICSVANADGTVGDADVTNVLVSCVDALPNLSLQVDDGRAYTRYGMLVDYVVVLHNGDSGVLTLTGIASAAADSAFIRRYCFGAGAGATCTADGEGPLLDANVRVPAGRTLTWLVTVPVRYFAAEGNLDYGHRERRRRERERDGCRHAGHAAHRIRRPGRRRRQRDRAIPLRDARELRPGEDAAHRMAEHGTCWRGRGDPARAGRIRRGLPPRAPRPRR